MGATAGEALVQHHTHCVEVGAGIERLAEELLGRHLVGGADHEPGLGPASVPLHRPGDPEIHELHQALRRHHDVRRLDVAVDDPLLVGRLQARQTCFPTETVALTGNRARVRISSLSDVPATNSIVT